ncbi:MAG: XdhC family protein [Rhodothermales bacterium]
MKELLRLLAEADRLRRAQQPFALATVVKINGSTYRRPGARMLIDPDGRTWGTISGGCLEQEVAQQALQVMEDGTPQLLPFDLSDDDLILGFGTGCNGIVHVLIEPVPAPNRTDPTLLVETCLESRRIGVLATVIDGPKESLALGRRVLLFEDGNTHGDLPESPLRDMLLDEAARTLNAGRHRICRVESEEEPAEVLFEVVRPPVRLVLFGTGHDVTPVVHVAKTMGWPVTIVGRKPPDVLAERFPEADDYVFLMHAQQALDYVTFDTRSAAVVMNHHYLRDKTLVGTLMQSPLPYIGALGPRARTERILSELCAENETLTDEQVAQVHGPVGLDIGTETPEEIALSMIAEIQAVHHARAGGMLRDRAEAIHEIVPVL